MRDGGPIRGDTGEDRRRHGQVRGGRPGRLVSCWGPGMEGGPGGGGRGDRLGGLEEAALQNRSIFSPVEIRALPPKVKVTLVSRAYSKQTVGNQQEWNMDANSLMHTCTLTHTHAHTRTFTHMHAHTHACSHTRLLTHTHAHTRVRTGQACSCVSKSKQRISTAEGREGGKRGESPALLHVMEKGERPGETRTKSNAEDGSQPLQKDSAHGGRV